MPSETIQHAIGLHFHQPAGTLPRLLRQDEGELRRILLCYERLARHAHKYAHVARLHVALSGVLLEQLRDSAFIDACRHLADIPAILDSLRSAPNIEFVGSGYRHAPLPLIPPEDREEQLRNERVAMEATLGRVLKGYLPPASRLTLDLIPALVQAGYEYVLLPTAALMMADGSAVDPWRAYRLRHKGVSIGIVPCDPGFSHAQQWGMEAPWFADEVRNGVAQALKSNLPYLLTTWSDGDSGEWFRRLDEEQGFFGHFFSPCMEFCETGEFPVRPVQLAEYLHRQPPTTDVALRPEMQTDAWVASLDPETREARTRLFEVVARYWSLARTAATQPGPSRAALLEARELTLQAEESSLLLGDATGRSEMLHLLDRAEQLLQSTPAQPKKPVQPIPVKTIPVKMKPAQPKPAQPPPAPPQAVQPKSSTLSKSGVKGKAGKAAPSRPAKKKAASKK